MASLITLPRASVLAYSGQQFFRDESGCCVSKNGNDWQLYNGWSGYDYSFL
jgi:hypothetical protein